MSKIISHVVLGDVVLCDMCNEDYTNSPVTGGLMFGDKAVCPECAPRIKKIAIKYGELSHIESECPADKSFAQWVREDLRNGEPGTITISTL